MTPDREALSDRLASVPFGTEKTAEDWVCTAGWWINELGDALPDAAPMFKALVDVLKECQRRGTERDRLRAENETLTERYAAVRHAYGVEAQERGRLEAENERLREAIALGHEICRANGWPDFAGSIDETSLPKETE